MSTEVFQHAEHGYDNHIPPYPDIAWDYRFIDFTGFPLLLQNGIDMPIGIFRRAEYKRDNPFARSYHFPDLSIFFSNF